MPKDKKDAGSSEPGKPFNEKVDELVAKAVPQKWLATAFAGAAGAALIFFIFMIVGFVSGPETKAEADERLSREKASVEKNLEKIKESLQKEQEEHATTKTSLREATTELRQTKRKAESADGEIKSAEARQKRAEDAVAEMKKKLADLSERLSKESRTKGEAEGSLRSVTRERNSLEKEKASALTRLKATEEGLADLRRKYDSLRKQKTDDAQRIADAKKAFDEIMNKAAAEDDLAKRLVLLRQLRDESLAELGGTDYARDLGSEIIRVEQQIEKQAILAKRKTTRKAGEAYADCMRQLKMTKDHETAMNLLKEVKEEVAGTDYEVRVHTEMEKREKAEKDRLARAVYDAAMKRLRDAPTAYEENLRALKAAMEETTGTAYAAKLKRYVDAKQNSLKEDIARAAYDSLAKQIRKTPPDYDANIAAAEEALATAKGSRYEAKISSILTSQQTRRLDGIGRAAYDKALAQVRGSTDRAANVAELESQKAKAAGSPWEAKINGLLVREQKYLEREKARNQ